MSNFEQGAELVQRARRIAAELRTWGVDEDKVDYDGEAGRAWMIVHLLDLLDAGPPRERGEDTIERLERELAAQIQESRRLLQDRDAFWLRVEQLDKEARERGEWQPIETADQDKPALLYTPPEALYEKSRGREADYRIASPRFWTWATHWCALPSPPAPSADGKVTDV